MLEKSTIIETFNEEEEFMYSKSYLFIKGYATGRGLNNVLLALPLARQLHNGQHRKSEIEMNGKKYQLPYVLHCLKVCSTLISLSLPLSHEEEDILLSAALLHDTFEDALQYFPQGGIELVTEHGLPNEVFEIIQLLSKHTGATDEELDEYFNMIKRNKLALLIKLADRSHNVEDLYVMKVMKLHKYVRETRMWIYDLCTFAKANYPELSNGITILKAKIVSLTELTETLVEKYEEALDEQKDIIKKQKKEIDDLKKQLESEDLL